MKKCTVEKFGFVLCNSIVLELSDQHKYEITRLIEEGGFMPPDCDSMLSALARNQGLCPYPPSVTAWGWANFIIGAYLPAEQRTGDETV